MSANVNQSLDDIIKSSRTSGSGSSSGASQARRKRSRTKSGSSKTGGVSKAAGAAAVSKNTKSAKNSGKDNGSLLAATTDLLANSKKVVVSGMPLDVDERQVRDFFARELGAINKVVSSFSAGGKPTGTFTITFKNGGSALQMFQKYNGTPVDGGKTKMNVQILLSSDVSPRPKSLADRLSLPAKEDKKTAKASDVKGDKNSKAKAKSGAAPIKTGKAGRKGRGNKRGSSSRTPKTAAELDAEMDDYFAAPTAAATTDASAQSEISV